MFFLNFPAVSESGFLELVQTVLYGIQSGFFRQRYKSRPLCTERRHISTVPRERSAGRGVSARLVARGVQARGTRQGGEERGALREAHAERERGYLQGRGVRIAGATGSLDAYTVVMVSSKKKVATTEDPDKSWECSYVMSSGNGVNLLGKLDVDMNRARFVATAGLFGTACRGERASTFTFGNAIPTSPPLRVFSLLHFFTSRALLFFSSPAWYVIATHPPTPHPAALCRCTRLRLPVNIASAHM